MAHGTRGRLALLGTGLLFCLGCMESEPKPIAKPGLQSKAPMPGLNGSTVKTPTGGNTTFGSGLQPAGYNTVGGGRPTLNNDFNNNYKSGGAINGPAIPGQMGNGTSMAPPSSVVPPTSPTGSFTGAPLPSTDPYAASRPTMPPAGLDALPPSAPGGPTGAFPLPPSPPPSAVNPLGGK